MIASLLHPVSIQHNTRSYLDDLSIQVMVKSGLLACGCLLYRVLCVSVSEML